jgi:hypothetical protein
MSYSVELIQHHSASHYALCVQATDIDSYRAIARTLKAAEHPTPVRFISPRAEPSVLDAH